VEDSLERLKSALADRYRLERELGSGGMATVYLAEDLKHHRKVAIKVMHPDLSSSIGAERFLREIRVSAQLNHPNILTLIDSGEADGLLYYVMPYVEGESLRDRLDREKQLPIAETVDITRELADALGHAHSLGIIHRDVKPENILFEADHAIVADFGIARAVTAAGGATLTETGLAIGTPAYMSPEQAVGERDVDARTDVYSLACMVYEMLGGDPPFVASTPQAILARKSLEAPPSLRNVRRTVSPAMEAAVTKALATTPADRFRTPHEFVEALAAPAPPATVKRRRLPRVAALVIAALVVAVPGGWLLSRASTSRWARREAIPNIIRLIEEGNQAAAFRLAMQVEQILPDDPTLVSLWPQMSRYVSLRTDPPGADFQFKEYAASDESWIYAGQSPVDLAKIPLGFFRWLIHKPGYDTIELASTGIQFQAALPDGTIPLHEEGVIPRDMVLVQGGEVALGVPGLQHMGAAELGDYLIDRFEVTNRAFKLFLDSGGYRREEYWQHEFVRDGREIPWEEAVSQFRDATGRPGPAEWQVGAYPEGQDDYPVGGVSWYEAAAYAAFVDKQLTTIYHWSHAAQAQSLGSHIVPLSNYGADGAAPVGSFQGLGPYGTYDMAGNVREWCWNATGNRRYVLGGGWGEESYFYVEADTRSPWDRSEVNGIRLMKLLGGERVTAAASRPMDYQAADFTVETVPEEIYRVYERMYRYDRTPLDAVVESVTEARDWRREAVTFRAAYGEERMTAYLFLPKTFEPAYQVVVYFPGSNALHLRSSETLAPGHADFVVRSGRALLYPIYKGTYERDVGLRDDNPDTTAAHRDLVVMWSKDLGRSIDYLETRADMDMERLAYYGVSWGAGLGAILPALERRITTIVLEGGGLWASRALPEADQRTFAPRISVPLLILGGRYDGAFPLETAQRPMFRLFGTPDSDKSHIVYESGHTVPRNESIREVLEWLDRHLGPVR
jgi:serine/threonine protein kinase/formylglycine-generating enzyme required for sulfatase activity/dienelactone hydrolase